MYAIIILSYQGLRFSVRRKVYPGEAFVCEDVLVLGPKILDQTENNITYFIYKIKFESSALTSKYFILDRLQLHGHCYQASDSEWRQ